MEALPFSASSSRSRGSIRRNTASLTPFASKVTPSWLACLSLCILRFQIHVTDIAASEAGRVNVYTMLRSLVPPSLPPERCIITERWRKREGRKRLNVGKSCCCCALLPLLRPATNAATAAAVSDGSCELYYTFYSFADESRIKK